MLSAYALLAMLCGAECPFGDILRGDGVCHRLSAIGVFLYGLHTTYLPNQ